MINLVINHKIQNCYQDKQLEFTASKIKLPIRKQRAAKSTVPSKYFQLKYHMRAIITRGLYTFYPIFESQKRYNQEQVMMARVQYTTF